jgi:hypothetical protein
MAISRLMILFLFFLFLLFSSFLLFIARERDPDNLDNALHQMEIERNNVIIADTSLLL